VTTAAERHATAMGAPEGVERCPLMPNYAAPGVYFASGEGSWLTDREGRRYLDLLAGLAVTSLGHAHPEVAEAVARQARTLLHVSNLFGSGPGWEVARTLDGLLGGGGQVFFANSGAEANECAIKLARRFGGRGRHVVVSAFGSFHGRTLATLHATGQPAKHEAFQPLPEGFRHVAFDDLAAVEAAMDPSVAAVLVEVIQGEGGVHPVSGAYLAGLRRLCDERGALLVIDEVQTGLGRTGDWFAHQHHGVVPDVVTVAKALGNGVPIGACWARAEVAATFSPGDHGSTFGGQPLATAAAATVLEVMAREDVPARARRAEARLRAGLEPLDAVVEVRGRGLLLGVELAPGIDARAVVAAGLDAGLVLNAVTPSALRLAPSLLIEDDEIDLALERLAGLLAEAADRTDTDVETEP
jgi:predicted acetylornithine/succinylornithine family transaminase